MNKEEIIAEEHVILDTALPENRNFELLKERALTYIKEMAGESWSNLNQSDPGITILEQVIYALTELGYVNNFPIEDILTNETGELIFENQFFRPEDILTCSPLTANDYRKLIVDRVPAVKNVVINPIVSEKSLVTSAYEVFLYIEPEDMEVDDNGDYPTAKEVDILLNRNRSLNEVFLLTEVLEMQNILLSGNIFLEDSVVPNEVLDRLNVALKNYVFPALKEHSYSDMREQGLDTNEIFNGPRMKGGWIPTEELIGEKENIIKLTELRRIISDVDGVSHSTELRFLNMPDDTTIVSIPRHKIAYFKDFDVSQLYPADSKSELTFFQKNITVDPFAPQKIEIYEGLKNNLNITKKIGAALDITPQTPVGNYREIGDYYSIQNTFPAIYGLGEEGLPTGSSDFRIAQLRQLKGYLLIFDQILANQFSQLANLNQLFSFKEKGSALDAEDISTYFYQLLYDIPDIRPVLAGNKAYNFHVLPEENSILEEESWEKYKKDFYNEYALGLKQAMETNEEAEQRRNNILDHLLARHGESGEMIDSMSSHPRWGLSFIRTKIQVKSFLLQNYQLLSANRWNAYDYKSADILALPASSPTEIILEDAGTNLENFQLQERDFRNFSTFELKTDLFLGLSEYYKSLIKIIAELVDFKDWQDWVSSLPANPTKTFALNNAGNISISINDKKHEISRNGEKIFEIYIESGFTVKENYENHGNQLNWFANQRKGFVFLENLLLLQSADFAFYLYNETHSYTFSCDFEECVTLFKALLDADQVKVTNNGFGVHFIHILDYTYDFIIGSAPNAPSDWERHEVNLEKEGNLEKYSLRVEFEWKPGDTGPQDDTGKIYHLEDPLYYFQSISLFPDYVELPKTSHFIGKLNKLQEEYGSAHIINNIAFASCKDLRDAIPAYVNWHNLLRHNPDGVDDSSAPNYYVNKIMDGLVGSTVISPVNAELNFRRRAKV